MLLKSVDCKDATIAELDRLHQLATVPEKVEIEWELGRIRSTLKGHEEVAKLIDLDYAESPNYLILHDLRLEVGGRLVQIDHLLINRWLNCIVLDSESYHCGIKITEEGDFLVRREGEDTFQGIPSPFQRNEQGISLLQEILSGVSLPSRLGTSPRPRFLSYVLVSSNAWLQRSRNEISRSVIKANVLRRTLLTHFNIEDVLSRFGSVARMVDERTLLDIGLHFVSLHRPAPIPDYSRTFARSGGTCIEPIVSFPAGVAGARVPGFGGTKRLLWRAGSLRG